MKLATNNGSDRRQATRSNGARVIGSDRIQAYCDAVAREFRPQKIVLFGSYAAGGGWPCASTLVR